jgi:CheY-like chemotaxis protein
MRRLLGRPPGVAVTRVVDRLARVARAWSGRERGPGAGRRAHPSRLAAPPSCLVLVVEDEAELRGLVRTVLEDAGFLVLEAADGPTGLELARRYRPCAVVVDLRRASMDGPAFARACRAGPGSSAPVIVLSAEPTARLRARRLGVEVVPKPFEVEELIGLVDRATGCRRSAA